MTFRKENNMYIVLSQEEYNDKISMDALREYVKVALEESKKQLYDYNNRENIEARTYYYSGKIDVLSEINVYQK